MLCWERDPSGALPRQVLADKMHSRPRLILLFAAALALAACAGRAHGVLVPIQATAPGASVVEMLVATTRSDKGAAPGEMFSGVRGERLSFADIAVSIPPDNVRAIGEVQWPSTPPGDPAHDFVTLRAERLDEPQALARFNAMIARTPRRQVLVFVHGYNTRFEDAVYRLAQIVHDARAPVTPVLFTWPSSGRLLGYGYDHESASYSRDALERVLQALARDKAVGEISILAHSMGNWVTLEALRQMAIRDKGLPAKIKNVMLAAPDVDFDVFQKQIAQIGDHSRFTVFLSRDDDALAVSQRVWGDKPRLGAVDIRQEPYREKLAGDHISVVDITGAKSDDPLGHGAFARSPLVVRSIGARLAGGQALSDAQAGLGDRLGNVAAGAASTVGSAAGAAVAAPFAIVDPATRENIGERLEAVGDTAGETLRSAVGGPPQ